MDEVLREKEENMLMEKAIDTLNDLFQLNNDRIEGYEKALENTEEDDLKALFSNFINTRRKCNQELSGEIKALGGTPVERTKTSGKFFRAWIDVRAALSGNERKAVFDSFVFGEEKAIESYKNVLGDDIEYLNSEQQTLLGAQLDSLRNDYNKVKSMRDALVEA
ncbi:hypothetical protein BH23BAC3_BH23BAC3_20060 [soil metagenome]